MLPVGVPIFHAHGKLYALVRSVHQSAELLRGEILYGGEYVKSEVLGHCCQVLAPPAVYDVPVKGHRTIGYAQLLVRYDQIGIKLHFYAQAVADLTGSKWGIEREHAGLKLLKGHAADGAGHLGGVELFMIAQEGYDQPLRPGQSIFHRLYQPGPVQSRVQPIHDQIYVMLFVTVQIDGLVGAPDLAIHPDPGEALGVEVGK